MSEQQSHKLQLVWRPPVFCSSSLSFARAGAIASIRRGCSSASVSKLYSPAVPHALAANPTEALRLVNQNERVMVMSSDGEACVPTLPPPFSASRPSLPPASIDRAKKMGLASLGTFNKDSAEPWPRYVVPPSRRPRRPNRDAPLRVPRSPHAFYPRQSACQRCRICNTSRVVFHAFLFCLCVVLSSLLLRDRCGGANGSIRFEPEINHGANAGLVNALQLLQPIKDKHPEVGWADLIQLASAAAIEQAGKGWS